MSNELIIPPDITPESPEEVTLVDDQTLTFRPQFGRNWTQRNSYADPRWRMQRKYRGLRMADAARMAFISSEAQGGFRTVMVSPAASPRGSFSTLAPEMLTNSDLSSTTGWTAGSEASIAVADNVLRVTRTANNGGGNAYVGQNNITTLTTNAPYVWRTGVSSVRGSVRLRNTTSFWLFYEADAASTSLPGYRRAWFNGESLGNVYADNTVASDSVAGDFYDLNFASLSRCALVDGGGNYLLYSDDFSNAAWTKSACSIVANSNTAPNGQVIADALVENSATTYHYVDQTFTVTSSIRDIMFAVVVGAGARTFCFLEMTEGGATSTACFFNLTNQATGSISTGAGWANTRAYAKSLGNGYTLCCIISRKATSATSVAARVGAATSISTSSYTGNGSGTAIILWRGTAWRTSHPSLLTLSTSATVTATSQTGAAIPVKGLPVSQTGLLYAGDWAEIDGQLKRVTAQLDSDAMGQGTLYIRPKVYRALTSGEDLDTPVIVTKPLGRFMLGAEAKWNAMYGLYQDYDLTFDEVYE